MTLHISVVQYLLQVVDGSSYATIASFSQHTKLVNALSWNSPFGESAGTC
jgi:hypothetical protein